ncbi:MAG TPA: hypothetical protein ENJ09_03460 [Planctomycetes bacterium]|nr:hypothetical protein [Planctomycetota bacterium]
MGSGRWRPMPTDDGSWTLIGPDHAEACHSRSGAWSESLVRYARACGLDEHGPGCGPAHLLDIGTGVGWNIAAALAALEDAAAAAGEDGRPAPLEVTTLERDPCVFDVAMALAGEEVTDRPELARAKGLLREVLRTLSRAREVPGERIPFHPAGRGGLRLLLGDARRSIRDVPPVPRFDAVFLDPFSPRRAPELWSEAFLAELARRMASGSMLSTYSASFRVRLGLHRVGLRVGLGPAFGAKREGTLASPDLVLPPLPERVAVRLSGSSSGASQEPLE